MEDRDDGLAGSAGALEDDKCAVADDKGADAVMGFDVAGAEATSVRKEVLSITDYI